MADLKLTYNDEAHTYYLNGRRAKSVTNVAKIPVDTFTLDQWDRRQVAIGLTLDPNLIEQVALDIDNKDALDKIVADAKREAKSHLKADRGTQMHRVLELVLLDREDRLLTDQQRADAQVLKRTLDRYKLTPHEGLTEQFVAWPQHTVTGRFDAVLERPDGELLLTDLKSGPNAVKYPQATAVQLALYARAPHISQSVQARGDKATVTDWREMPNKLNRRLGFVLLVEPDSDIGTLHELDIQHGWAAAQLALQIVDWRKKLDYGKSIAHQAEFIEAPGVPSWESLTAAAGSVEDLRVIWNQAKQSQQLTEELKALLTQRSNELEDVA